MIKTQKTSKVYRIKNTDGCCRYLVGDLGYLFEDQDEWNKLGEKGFNTDDSGVYHHRNSDVFMCWTCGDGYHPVFNENEEKVDTLPVDAGMIGLMSWDVAMETSQCEYDDNKSEEENFQEWDEVLMKNHMVYESDEDFIEIEVFETHFVIDGQFYVSRGSGYGLGEED